MADENQGFSVHGGGFVYGQHRNAALAERHRAEIERSFGDGWTVKITARRNARGEFSKRGQFFTFEARPDFMELDEFEEYMDSYDGPLEDFEIESGGDTGEDVV